MEEQRRRDDDPDGNDNRARESAASETAETASGPASGEVATSGRGALGEPSPRDAPTPLEERPILVTGRSHLTVSSVVALLLWAAGAGYFVGSRLEVAPLKDELARTQEQRNEVSYQLGEATRLRLAAERTLEGLLAQENAPTLVSPVEGKSLIGSNVSLEWDYGRHSTSQKYKLELRYLGERSPAWTRRYNVANPQSKRLHYAVAEAGEGTYLWRIAAGETVPGPSDDASSWSAWRSFHVDGNLIERIERTGELSVATVPTLHGVFNAADGRGRHRGFDVDWVEWLGAELARLLERPVAVKIRDMTREELFEAVQSKQVDLGVGTLTRSRALEKEYPGLRFSTGYLPVHQRFVRESDESRSFPGALSGAKVAVVRSTINETAARLLARRWGFHVDADNEGHGDLFRKLHEGTANFALVDRQIVPDYLGGRLAPFGPDLTSELEPYYAGDLNLGFEREEYGIVVGHEPHEARALLERLNEIIASKQARRKLEELREKWLGVVAAEP